MNETKKFIFNCTGCGKCCEREAQVYLEDIINWMEHGMMYQVLPHLSVEGKFGSMTIQLDRVTKEDRTVCALFDIEKSECTIKDNKPVSCRSYPLGYNGKNYIIIDKECPGLGQGKMTAESLSAMREIARQSHENHARTQLMMPMLEALFIKRFTIQSQKAIEELPPEKREELEKILKS
jgi:Fe-S-cluster containining protein